jgi:hypothetical protein
VNVALVDRYPEAAVSSHQVNMSCNMKLGFRNHSRLCQTCVAGYSRSSQSKCVSCNNADGSGSKSWLIFVAVFGLLIFFVGLNTLRMRSFRSFDAQRRKKSLHSTIKRIMVSHIQMIGIVLGLSVPWPQLLEEFLQAASSVGSFSESVNGFECLYNDVDHSKFYNGVLVLTAVGPLFFAGCIGLYWFVLVKWFKVLKCGSHIKSGPLCPKKNQAAEATPANAITSVRKVTYTDVDAFISSAVLLWYLILPSLLQISTSALKCWEVGGKDYVFIDLEKSCWEGDHLLYALLVASPMILFYGGILPGYFMFRLHLVGPSRLTDPSLMLRWGMLHSGYREKKFWWEIIVLVRKYLIIVLATFNNRGEFQLHFALGILLLALHLHDSQHPYGYKHVDSSNAILHRYEMASLLIVFFMIWCAGFFSLGFCNRQEGWCSFMVILVLGGNVVLFGILLVMYAKEFCKRNNLDTKIIKLVRRSFFGSSMNVLTEGSTGEVKLAEKLAVKVETKKKRRLSSRELMLEMKYQEPNKSKDERAANLPMLNPMYDSNKSVSKSASELNNNNLRKHWDTLKDSITSRNTVGTGGGSKRRAKRLSKVIKKMKENEIEVLQDEVSGRRYSHNMTTGETKWIDLDEEVKAVEINIEVEDLSNEKDLIKVFVDEETGRRYSWNVKTEETKWLDDDE